MPCFGKQWTERHSLLTLDSLRLCLIQWCTL